MTDIVLFGCGALGTRLLRVLESDYASLNVVGAVDDAASLQGRTLAEICDCSRFSGIGISNDLMACLSGLSRTPALLIHMTESKPERIETQLLSALNAGLNVVSAAESMFYAPLRHPEFSERLNAAALAKGVTISGLGINPGFSYDLLPLTLARATSAVSAIRIHRTIDVTGTGPGDIEHVGYGLTPEEFRAGVAAGNIVGHMGGPESLALMAEHLGLKIDLVTEEWDTETAEFDVDSGDASLGILPPGHVIGITQKASASHCGSEVITTRLSMYYQPERFGLVEADVIEIDAAMPVRMTIQPAVQSLFGAANVLASAILPTFNAAPGLINGLAMPVATRRDTGLVYEIDSDRAMRPGQVPLRPRARLA